MTAISTQLANEIMIQYASLLNDWMPKDATIAIALEDQYVYYSPKKIDIGLTTGSKIHEQSIAKLVYTSREKVQQVLTHPMTNTEYFGIGYPITFHRKQGALIVILPPKAEEQVQPKKLQFITGKMEDEWQPLLIEEISFFESLNKKNWCYQQQQEFQVSLTMKELSERLPEYFIRIHRSYIINIRHISKITRDFSSSLLIIMKNGEQLPVAQSYVSVVRKALEF